MSQNTCLDTPQKLVSFSNSADDPQEKPIIQSTFDNQRTSSHNQCSQESCSRLVEDGHLFCQNCYQNIQKGNYCQYCQQVYPNEDDGKDYIECDSCKRWVHQDCERAYGKKLPQCQEDLNRLKYYCPRCTSHEQNSVNKFKHKISKQKTSIYQSKLNSRTPPQEYRELCYRKKQGMEVVRKTKQSELRIELTEEQIEEDLKLLQLW